MASDGEKSQEWTHIHGGGQLYETVMRQIIEGGPMSGSDRKLIENIPKYAVECLKCSKLNLFSKHLKSCPNCAGIEYAFSGTPSQLRIVCARCGDEVLSFIKCACGCVDRLNGETLRQPKTGGCFIATAAYDSSHAPEVMIFRQFRDEVMVASRIGKPLVGFYYLASPPLAGSYQKCHS